MIAERILLLASPCFAFYLPDALHRSPAYSFRKYDAPIGLPATSNGDDETAAQDVRLFLTQRCIQSFMFLLAATRDLHTVWWLDDFVQPVTINNYWADDVDLKPMAAADTFRESDKRIGSKLLNYHGLAALNTTIFPAWDTFFTSLLEQPDTVLKVSTPKDMGQRIYSEFDIDIEPARLCARILSVREQLAKEMTGDLKAIANMGQMIFRSYWKNAKERKNTRHTRTSGARAGGINGESSPYGFDRPGTMYINFDPQDDNELASSPLRKGNFDLLYNLITQTAVIQLLQCNEGVVVGEDELQNISSQSFLSKFYLERQITHFIGSQWYGKGDDFIEELILSSPIIMSRNTDSFESSGGEDSEAPMPPLVIEPMRIAEQILLRRDKLALEWKEILQGASSEHTEIRKLQLSRLTGLTTAAFPAKVILFEDEFQ